MSQANLPQIFGKIVVTTHTILINGLILMQICSVGFAAVLCVVILTADLCAVLIAVIHIASMQNG